MVYKRSPKTSKKLFRVAVAYRTCVLVLVQEVILRLVWLQFVLVILQAIDATYGT